MSPWENKSSTISFAKGSKSPWWIAYPFIQIIVKNWNWCISLSSALKVYSAWEISLLIWDFSLLFVRSYANILPASALIFFLEKVKITQGNKFFLWQSTINYYRIRCYYLPSEVYMSVLEIFFINLSTACLFIIFTFCSLLLSL